MIAGFLMVLHNPMIVAFDPSFQLSFVATLGLITISPLLEKYFLWVTPRFGARDIVLATLSTQIMVLPLLLSMTGMFSVVALPANLLILPVVPFAMLFGFVTSLIVFVATSMAIPFAWITTLLLWYQLMVAKFFGALPFSSFGVPEISPLVVATLYVAIGGYIYARTRPAS